MAPEGRDPLETDDLDDDRGQTGDGTDQAGRNSQRIPVGCCVDLRRFRDQFRDFGAHLYRRKGSVRRWSCLCRPYGKLLSM